jgi:hypothetical protein
MPVPQQALFVSLNPAHEQNHSHLTYKLLLVLVGEKCWVEKINTVKYKEQLQQ